MVLLLRIRSSFTAVLLDIPGLSCIVDKRCVTSPANVDIYVQIPEPQITGASRPVLLIPMDRLSFTNTPAHGVSLVISPLHRLTVQMAGHISYQPWSHPHQNAGAI